MINKDFENLSKFKLILPTVCIFSLFSLFFGPFYFPVINQILCFSLMVAQSSKFVMYGILNIYGLFKSNKILTKSPKSRFIKSNDQ